MKYKTFRLLVGSAAVVVIAGTVWGASAWMSARRAEEHAARVEAERYEVARGEAAQRAAQDRAARGAARAPSSAAAVAGGGLESAPGLRPVDLDVLALVRMPAQEKIKDATKGKQWKVNLYAAAGAQRFERAKVDLDRDEKWDESWSFKADGSIERQVAPADDEKYSQTFRLDARSGWIDLAAPAPSSTASSTTSSSSSAASAVSVSALVLAGGGAGLRPVDQDMATVLRLPVQEKIKDATKGKSYKINLYSDDRARFNRAKVDLDRDDKWDESWTFKPDGTTERQVSPQDNEAYTEVWALGAAGWTKK